MKITHIPTEAVEVTRINGEFNMMEIEEFTGKGAVSISEAGGTVVIHTIDCFAHVMEGGWIAKTEDGRLFEIDRGDFERNWRAGEIDVTADELERDYTHQLEEDRREFQAEQMRGIYP